MLIKPRGLRAFFWKCWGWDFNRRLLNELKDLEKRDHYSPQTVSNTTTNMLNKEAAFLIEKGAINRPVLFWNGVWIVCEVKK